MHLPCTTTSTVKSHVSMDISDVFDMPNVANMTPWLSLLLVINELLFTAMDFTGVFFSLTYQKYYILSLFYYSILQELECRPWLVDQVCINLHQLNLWLLLCLSVKLIRSNNVTIKNANKSPKLLYWRDLYSTNILSNWDGFIFIWSYYLYHQVLDIFVVLLYLHV